MVGNPAPSPLAFHLVKGPWPTAHPSSLGFSLFSFAKLEVDPADTICSAHVLELVCLCINAQSCLKECKEGKSLIFKSVVLYAENSPLQPILKHRIDLSVSLFCKVIYVVHVHRCMKLQAHVLKY